ncbi:unnamed protein product, partial [Adineta steineri]
RGLIRSQLQHVIAMNSTNYHYNSSNRIHNNNSRKKITNSTINDTDG